MSAATPTVYHLRASLYRLRSLALPKPKKAASITTTLRASAAARVERVAGSFASSAGQLLLQRVSGARPAPACFFRGSCPRQNRRSAVLFFAKNLRLPFQLRISIIFAFSSSSMRFSSCSAAAALCAALALDLVQLVQRLDQALVGLLQGLDVHHTALRSPWRSRWYPSSGPRRSS